MMGTQENLIEKYDILGPRYTSYPPVPFWKEPPSAEKFSQQIVEGHQFDLYIHIPFCRQICHYCGCNRYELESSDQVGNYIQALLKEWSLYKKSLEGSTVKHLHFGGGTPTIMTAPQWRQLLKSVNLSDITGSLEADPRSTDYEKLAVMADFGFKKISFGVQDFDCHVQAQIGRDQPFERVAKSVELARKCHFESINFDLIFGLPGQTEETIKATFEKVTQLRPDTIAFYSFAYVPSFAPNQGEIDGNNIPQGTQKRKLYECGRTLLESFGYKEIGMDHFALESSSLYQNFLKKNITRSFMGYTVSGSQSLLGLGTSSISSTSRSYAQNHKQLDSYYNYLSQERLPIFKGHCLTEDEAIIAKKIQEVMCQGETNLPDIAQYDFSDLVGDNLVVIEGDKLKVNPQGRAFLRNICMRFDPIVLNKKEGTTKFSRTV